MTSIIQTLAGLKTYLAFILHSSALVGLFVLAFFKGMDTSTAMIGVLVSYMGGRTIAQASAHWAASKDDQADTATIINNVNEK
jgi:hypothetical protein